MCVLGRNSTESWYGRSNDIHLHCPNFPGFDCDLVSSLLVWKLDRKNPNGAFIMPTPNTIDLDHIASEGQSDQGHLSFQKLCWSPLAGKINTKIKKTPCRQLKWIIYKM